MKTEDVMCKFTQQTLPTTYYVLDPGLTYAAAVDRLILLKEMIILLS
jgi:hypothetical protein